MAGKKKAVHKPRQSQKPRYTDTEVFELVAHRHPLTSERGAAIILGDEKDLGSVNPPSGNPIVVPT